ncbi:MAG: hypothetical protein CSA72_12525 [Rhodobacterales bacterium]|nr:MAG: hypothetical protein CSA72_12525 [Rhodobacterales bacterium]
MKIAHIISHNDHNGVTSSGSALVREMHARGHEVTLIHRPNAWIGKQSFPEGVRLVPMDMGKRILNYGECRRVRALLDDWGVDVIHTHGTGADRIGALWYWRWDRPVVAKAAARIPHFHWHFHDAIFAPSPYTKDWYVNRVRVPERRVHVVTNFVHDHTIPKPSAEGRAKARVAMGLPDTAFVLGVVGSVQGRKNQSAGVPILHALRGKGVDAHMVLAGRFGGEEPDKIRARARELGVEDAVHLLGHREDVMDLLAGFDVAFTTTKDEQGSIVVIESMGAHLPVVSTPVGMVPVLIEDGVNGHRIDLAAPGATVAYLERLATDPAFAAQQSANARKDFEERFLPDPILTRIEGLYTQLIEARGRKA